MWTINATHNRNLTGAVQHVIQAAIICNWNSCFVCVINPVSVRDKKFMSWFMFLVINPTVIWTSVHYSSPIHKTLNTKFVPKVFFGQNYLKHTNSIYRVMFHETESSSIQNILPLSTYNSERFEVRKSVHHHTIQTIQPTRCNTFTNLLPDVYVWLNMFWASPRPHQKRTLH